MKRNILLSGIIFGLFMLIAQIITKLIVSSTINIISSIIGSIASGLVFSLFMYLVYRKGNKIEINDLLEENEDIINEGIANRIVNYESVGGKLFLTKKRIIFKPHKLNIQDNIFKLNIDDILDFHIYKTWQIIPNGIKITTTENKIEKFVVNNPNKWISTLRTIHKRN